jgi:hypothetical protein
MTDARKNVRYRLQVPAVSRWKDKERGEEHRVEGRIRDLSVGGAFIYAPVCPPAGETVKLNIVLATIPDSLRSLRLAAEGRVVRSEQPAGGQGTGGFAVLLERLLVHGGDVIAEIE